MKHLTNLFEQLRTVDFEIRKDADGKEKWSQNQRNSTRASILEALKNDLVDAGFEAYRVDKGISVVVPNDELGQISFVLAPTMSDFGTDPIDDHEEWERKQKAKAEKAEARKAKAKKAA